MTDSAITPRQHPQPLSSTRVGRRALLASTAAGLGAAGAAGLAGPAGAAPGKGPGKGPGSGPVGRGLDALARNFARPGTASAAGFRWWWPNGEVDPRQVAREVDQVADAGFGVLEIADVTHSLRAQGIELDLERAGWGTPRWVAGVKAALTAGARRGVRIDITVGPSWPAAVSTITPDSEAACSELAHGRVDVAGGSTFDGPLPEPVVPAADGVARRTLVAVQAFRVTAQTAALTTLDPTSLVDLTASVRDGALRFDAPADGTWAVLAYWQRGSAQEPEAGPHTSPASYVVDHFSRAGAQAVVDLWEERILDREMRRLLQRAGGYLFEDSLEIETDATIWTPDLLGEFRRRRGYDLLPLLPVVVEAHEKYLFAVDTATTNQVRDDFNQTISDLYRDHHLLVVQAFARTLGMGLRVQPYGLETDALEHAALLDVPETESLGFKNLDDYRILAGGRDIAGHTLLSCEAICYNGAAYNTRWGADTTSPTAQNQALVTLNSIFAAGVNRAIVHGFPHATAPGVGWPGFAAFSPYYDGAIGYGEAWGPRTPQWRHVPGIAAYLARTQLVLQTGRPTYDIVFLRQKAGASTGIGPFWVTNEGTKLGWSHGFITAALLTRPDVRVRGGRLAPDGPAYKVLVIGPDKIRGREVTIDLAAARRVLELGRAGLPVVLVNDAGKDWTRDATPIGRTDTAAVAEVRRLMGQIAALPTTRSVLEAGVGQALAELGVRRDVEHADSTVQHVHRVLDQRGAAADLYYLANARHAENRRLTPVRQDVWLTASDRRSVPHLLDAWTGDVVPVAAWERDGDRVRVGVDLVPGQSTVVALAPPRGRRRPAVTAASGPVRREGDRVLVRATAAGPVSATVGGSRVLRASVARVREAVVPAAWDLELEDWQPGPTPTTTLKPVRRTRLATLAPWSQLPGLEDVSGVGRYTTVVDLGRDWRRESDGAVLELGDVTDTFEVRVNGELLPPCDPLDTAVDLGHRLRPGRNTIAVEVASTLLNRLRTVNPAVYGVAARQAYGLLGPVRLVPYVETEVTRR